MRKLYLTTAMCIALTAPCTTNAAPSCTGTCKLYPWSSDKNTFICQGTCTCSANKVFTCYNPCTELLYQLKCGMDGLGTTAWDKVLTDDVYQTGTEYSCFIDTLNGACMIATLYTRYRCNTGYYGTSTDGETGCTSCATATGNPHATSAVGSTQITDCYVPAGLEFDFTDSTGSGIASFESKCNYTQ